MQVIRGAPIPPLDLLGNVLSFPAKLILWNWRFNSHTISSETEEILIGYLEANNLPAFEATEFRLNQYAPVGDLKRLITNRHVAWPYRLLIGLPVTLVYDVLLPGRLFPWGDHYNPFTNTVYLYSDDAAIALHEAGHAYDFSNEPFKGTYAAVRLLPFVNLYQEWRATDLAVEHLIQIQDRERELHAYRVLWPAYGTYVGGYALLPFGSVAGALLGHVIGRYKAGRRERYYEALQPGDNPKSSLGTPY